MALALDFDAVIGFLDRSDALHAAATARLGVALGAGTPLIVSVITYAEVMTGAKRGRHDESLVRGFFADLVADVVAVELPTAERAAELRGRHRALRMPDALILATAELHDRVDQLLCADRRMACLEGLDLRVDLLDESP